MEDTNMADKSEDLYETRTNLLSCDNMVDYFWRRSDHNSYPFKPTNAIDVKTKSVDEDREYGKDIFSKYTVSDKDKKNSGIKPREEYNFDTVAFQTLNLDKQVLTQGLLILVYKPDRKWYSLFLLENVSSEHPTLTLLMKVKQKVSLFGSFQNEMTTFY